MGNMMQGGHNSIGLWPFRMEGILRRYLPVSLLGCKNLLRKEGLGVDDSVAIPR
jgi:hypothetical protein